MAETMKQDSANQMKATPRKTRRASKARTSTARRAASKAPASRRKVRQSNGMAASLMSQGRSALNGASKWAGEVPQALKNMHMPDTRSVQAMANDRPLLLGAVGLGIGVLIGALLPSMHASSSRSHRR